MDGNAWGWGFCSCGRISNAYSTPCRPQERVYSSTSRMIGLFWAELVHVSYGRFMSHTDIPPISLWEILYFRSGDRSCGSDGSLPHSRIRAARSPGRSAHQLTRLYVPEAHQSARLMFHDSQLYVIYIEDRVFGFYFCTTVYTE
jgi:hypothetical protein